MNVRAGGPGNSSPVAILRDDKIVQVEMRWGFEPFESGGPPDAWRRSEGMRIVNPCLIVANDFGREERGPSKYLAKLITDRPFFCLAGIWREATPSWPASFAAITVEAYPDIEPFKERNLAVIRHEDWLPWLQRSKPIDELLRPFDRGSFTFTGGQRRAAAADLFANG